MPALFRNSRFYVLVFSISLSLLINVIVVTTIPAGQLQTIRLNQIYGLLSVAFLYLAILAGPLCYTFTIPFAKHYLHARRAIGVSAFYFAMLHSLIAFFGQLEGFAGIGFLTTKYLVALGVSSLALLILTLQATTSFDAAINWMTFPRWKILQRFVYAAAIFVLIHTIMLGTHYNNLFTLVPQVTFVAVAFLLLLEAPRLDLWLEKKFGIKASFNYASLIIIGGLVFSALYLFTPVPGKEEVSLSVHSGHESTETSGSNAQFINSMPGMQGDRKLRYTVGLQSDEVIPGEETVLKFPVYNAVNGNQVKVFQKLYEKEAHLIIVNNDLSYFEHIHPERNGNDFDFTTTFPAPGLYRLYLSYQPVGAIEQQEAFSLRVGISDEDSVNSPEQTIDTNMTKVVDKYAITLVTGRPLSARELNAGLQTLSFTFKEAGTTKDVKTIKPYLGAFGHLAMINQKDYSFLHVHPKALKPPAPYAKGGPVVEFLPMRLQDEITPGIYRLFGEFYPDGYRVVVEYTVEVGQ